MAIQHRTAAEYKSYLVEQLIAFERLAGLVQASASDLARLNDTEVATLLGGIPTQDANFLKGAYADANTALAAWSKTNFNAALGVRIR
jgi:hypothetical protein